MSRRTRSRVSTVYDLGQVERAILLKTSNENKLVAADWKCKQNYA